MAKKDISRQLFEFDESYRRKGYQYICGVDEAGRGPLSGPVVAAAVILPKDREFPGVNDSKKLSAIQRDTLFDMITKNAIAYEYSLSGVEEIDTYNILGASLRAMNRSVRQLQIRPAYVLIDGNKKFDIDIPVETVVKGDGRSLSIAAASIIAKVIRDRIMNDLDKEYPLYLWKQNKGYPTKEHIQAVLRYGSTPHHRKTFLKNITLWEQNDLFNQKTGK